MTDKKPIFNPVPKKPNYKEIGAILDGACEDNDDDYLDAASVVSSNLHVNTANAIMEWCNESTIPLDDGETQATRLYVLLLDAAGIDLETDITDDEAEAFDLVCDIAIKYLVSKGVDEAGASELIDSLGSNNADDIGDTVFDYLCDKLPNDDDAITDDMADFGILDNTGNGFLDAASGYKSVLKKKGLIVSKSGKEFTVTAEVSTGSKSGTKEFKSVKNGNKGKLFSESDLEFLAEKLQGGYKVNDLAFLDGVAPCPSDGDYYLDAVFKKVTAIRGGKKVRVKKRIAGSVHLSSKQRAAIKKAGRRAHSSTANMKRMRSMTKRKQMNLKTL